MVLGANVTIVSADTGVTQTIVSGKVGDYSSRTSPLDGKRVRVGQPGFEKFVTMPCWSRAFSM